MAHKYRLVIIAVIYNSHPETLQFVESVSHCFGNEAGVILVDNSPAKPGSSFTEKILTYDFITYLYPGKNTGYFHGAQYGLAHYLEKHQSYPEWIMVSNVDIIFETRGFLDILHVHETDADLGIIAPAIVSKKWKTDLNPFLTARIPVQKLHFLQAVYSNILIHNGYILIYWGKKIINMLAHRVMPTRKSRYTGSQTIYAPHGSCMLFNQRYFTKGGTLHHISFLFGEEIFVAETAQSIGLKVLYLPELKVIHDEHSSIGNFISGKINGIYRQSLKDIIAYYYNGKQSKDS